MAISLNLETSLKFEQLKYFADNPLLFHLKMRPLSSAIIFMLWTSLPSSVSVNQFEKSIWTLQQIDKIIPLVGEVENKDNFMVCARDCSANKNCFAILFDKHNKTCNAFGDEKYTVAGTFDEKYVADEIWMVGRACPEPFDLVGNGCYHPVLFFADWSTAKLDCENMHPNGRLAEFHSLENQIQVATHLQNSPDIGAYNLFWVGGILNYTKAPYFQWDSTKKNVSEELWMSPRSATPSTTPQWCTLFSSILMNLMPPACTAPAAYICETY